MVPKRKNAVHSNFVFLSYEPNPTRTDQVLQDSQRRAHAARKSHAASRQRQRDEVMSGSNTASYSSVLLEQSVQGAESPPKVKQNLPDQITRHNERIEAGTGQYAPLLLYDLPHSLHRLAQNPIDPFNSFAAKGLPDYVYKVLYFGKSSWITPLSAQGENTCSSKILTCWMIPMLTSKLMTSGRNQMGKPQTFLVS